MGCKGYAFFTLCALCVRSCDVMKNVTQTWNGEAAAASASQLNIASSDNSCFPIDLLRQPPLTFRNVTHSIHLTLACYSILTYYMLCFIAANSLYIICLLYIPAFVTHLSPLQIVLLGMRINTSTRKKTKGVYMVI